MPRRRSSKTNLSDRSVIQLKPEDDEVVCIRNINDCEIVSDDHDSVNNNKIIDLTKPDVLAIQDEVLTTMNNEIVSISSDDDNEQNNLCLDNEYLVEIDEDGKKRVDLQTINRSGKFLYGFSKFEFKHDTKLLDRFFIQKKVPTVSKKRKREYETVVVDENISFKSSNTIGNFKEEANSEYMEELEVKEEKFLNLTNHQVFLVKTRNNNEDNDYVKDQPNLEKHDSLNPNELKDETKSDKEMNHDLDTEDILITTCENFEKLLEIAFGELEMFLTDEENNKLVMSELSQMIKDGVGDISNDVLPCSSTSVCSEGSEVILSDDEFFTDDHQILEALSTYQVQVLEESWKDWPFPSQAVMTDICGQTSLNVQTVISWFVKKNKAELRNILPDSNNKFSDN